MPFPPSYKLKSPFHPNSQTNPTSSFVNNKKMQNTAMRRASSSASASASTSCSGGEREEEMRRMITENAVLVVGKHGCCMSDVAKRLLLGLGVNPPVCEVGDDVDDDVDGLMEELSSSAEGGEEYTRQFPAVFIGGRLVGGIDRLMALHISGQLVPILKQAGALWL